MREIKFRGKIKENYGDNKGQVILQKGKWIYGGIISNDNRIWINTPYYGQIAVDKETVGQYTGLHDKNGKEIYEGDIVNILVNNNIERKRIVEFKNGIFGVMFDKQVELTAFPHFYNTTFEVIGNIYENKELLNETNR